MSSKWKKRKSATIAVNHPARKVRASKSFSSTDRIIPSITVTRANDLADLPISDNGISSETESFDDHYENAAENLYRTVSSVAAPTFTMGRALSVMLEEVEKDDTLDAE
uniref:Uncharacterized protein n=1 Tax=Romanomermis culicivorax TaxID=13658 RepID=A0A915I6T2_ROMCU